MSELKQYFEAFSARLLSPEGLTAEECRCNGGGWILSDVDTWHKCPDHFAGQQHPEDFDYFDGEEVTQTLTAAEVDALAAQRAAELREIWAGVDEDLPF